MISHDIIRNREINCDIKSQKCLTWLSWWIFSLYLSVNQKHIQFQMMIDFDYGFISTGIQGLNLGTSEWILFDILMVLLQLFISFPFIKAQYNGFFFLLAYIS